MNKINFQNTQFITSAANNKQLPADVGAEIAFIGRSNAGKSSAINLLCQRKNLAKVSKTPGRTQLLNFFAIDENKRLVDLPGYGYAKVPENIKSRWNHELNIYFQKRKSLRGLILLMDIRHPLKPFDEYILDWAESVNLPIHILLTKADKLKRSAQKTTLLLVQKELKKFSNASTQLFSATEKIGLDDLIDKVSNWLT